MKRGKKCFVAHCFGAAPFASPANPEVHACENHKKRDFVNMRNKRCLAKGCYRNPHYGVSRLIDPNSKAQYCTEHKSPGMQNVNGGRCAGPDCSKQPRFSLPGEKGKYCSKHRGEGMVDVLYTPCAAEGCKKHPHFGLVEGGPRYCAQHRAEGMVDVKHRRCAVKGCRKDRVQITPGTRKRGKYCEVHCDESEAADTTSMEGQSRMDHDAASSDDCSNERKRSRTWKAAIEADGDYTSSDGCPRGYSTENVGRRSSDYPEVTATRPVVYPTAYEQGHPVVHAENVRVPRYVGVAMQRESAYAPLESARQMENVHGYRARDGDHLDDHLDADACDETDERHLSRRAYYPEGTETDPYPLFQRGKEQSYSKPTENEHPSSNASSNSSSHASSHARSSATAPAPPFRLRYFEPKSSSTADYSYYPCPWEFTREGQSARRAEAGFRDSEPTRGWSGYPTAS